MPYETFNASLLSLALKGAAILAAGHLLTLALRGKSAATRHLVLTLTALAVLMLPLLVISLPRWSALPSPQVEPVHVAVMMEPMEQPLPGVTPAVSAPLQTPPAAMPAEAGTPTTPFDWTTWIAPVWLMGAVLCLLPLAIGTLSLVLLRRRCQVIEAGSWRSLLDQCAEQLHLRRPVLLLRSERRTMPMTWGVRQAAMLIPAEADDWPAAQRRAVVLHELGHVKRRDCLMHMLGQLACAMHWFNPLAWWALHRMRTLRESACDDLVLTAEGHFRGSDYAQQLLNLAANLRAPALSAHASIAMAQPSALEGRLLAILDPRKNRKAVTRRMMLAAAALCLLIAAPLAMLRAAEPTTEDESKEQASSNLSALVDGVTVELVGLCEHPSKGKSWWKPDGSPLAEAPYEQLQQEPWPAKEPYYEMAFRVSAKDATDYDVQFGLPDAHMSGSVTPLKNGKPIEDLRAWRLAVAEEKNLTTTTVLVNIATGPWQTPNTLIGTGSMAIGGNDREHNIALAPAYEQDGRVCVTTAVSSPASTQVRIVAIDHDDKEHLPTGTTSSSSPGVRSITSSYADLTLDQLKGFREQVRPYQTVTFRNVSLKPGHATQPAATLDAASPMATIHAGPQESIACTLIDDLMCGRDEQVTQHFDATMKKALPAEKLDALRQQVIAAHGEYQGVGEPRRGSETGFDVVYVPAKHQADTVQWKVVLNQDHQVAGLWLVGVDSAADDSSADQRQSRVIVEDLAREMMVAVRDHDDAAFKSLATDAQTPGWIEALPHFALELREQYRAMNDGKPMNVIEIAESVVDGQCAAAKFPGPKGAADTYLAMFFVKTPDGWRNYLLHNAPPTVSLREMLTKYAVGNMPKASTASPESWRAAFDAVYRLDEGEALRRIAPPFIPQRVDHYKTEESGQHEVIHEPPDCFTFHWDNGERKPWGYSFIGGGSSKLDGVLRHSLGLSSFEFEGPKQLLEIELPGDWIVREKTTPAQRLAALSEILQHDLHRSIRFEQRQVEREVVVVSGQYEFHPLAESYDPSAVHIYAETLDPDEGAGGGSGDFAKFLTWVGDRINMRIINESQTTTDMKLHWANHNDSSYMRMGDQRDEKIDQVLANLAKQTSLSFKREQRKVEVWFVEEDRGTGE